MAVVGSKALGKRSVTDANAVNGVVLSILRSDAQEEQFVKDKMTANPGFARIIAGMLRNKTILRTYERMNGTQICPLGTPLRAEATKFKHLSRPYRFFLFFHLIKRGRTTPNVEWVVSDSGCWVDLKFALEVDDETPLPDLHHHPRYEGTLTLVLEIHYDKKGQRLLDVNMDSLKALGYFGWKAAKPLEVTFTLSKKPVKLNLKQDQIDEAADWKLDNNCSLMATLSSEKAGLNKLLWGLAEAQLKITKPDLLEEFDYDKAADSLKNVTPKEELPLSRKEAKRRRLLAASENLAHQAEAASAAAGPSNPSASSSSSSPASLLASAGATPALRAPRRPALRVKDTSAKPPGTR